MTSLKGVALPTTGPEQMSLLWGPQAGPLPAASLPTLFKVELSAGGGFSLLGQSNRLLGLSRATEKPARPGCSLEPEGGAQASLEEGEACGLLAALVQVLDAHVLGEKAAGCRVRLRRRPGQDWARRVFTGNGLLRAMGGKGLGTGCRGRWQKPAGEGHVDLARHPQVGAEMPEWPGGQAAPQGPLEQDASHLQLQGRPLPCLHTGQAAPASLDPQEDGNLGAVQASVGKYADLLWEGREERARA